MRASTIVLIGIIAAGVVTSGVARSAHAQQAAQAQKTCRLKIAGMTCGGCATAVKIAAKKIDGVVSTDVSYEKGQADVTYDPAKTNPAAIAKAISERTGFKAEAQESRK